MRLFFITALAVLVSGAAGAGFVHPGCLSTRADLERMAAKVNAGEQPWTDSWNMLVENTDGFLDDEPGVQSPIKAGGGGENYIRLARDCAKTYQLALRYCISGEHRFADKAVEILNAWASDHDEWAGDTNVRLRAGLYGYQFACTAELLRNYPGWKRNDFRAFQEYMLEQFYPHNKDFLHNRHGTVPGHYWANWNLSNLASMMAIGVLCDDRDIFDEALDFFYHGEGNERLENAVPFIHPNGLGQFQESGRDQGHSLMGPQLLGVICEIAWNQGIDLYGRDGNRVLAGVEYVSRYNLGYDVPFATYIRIWKHPGREQVEVQNRISPHGRGAVRPGWDLVYNHYVNRRGLAAPYTKAYAEKARPEGGGFNYGGSSGGFDSLGFTTLTHTLDPIREGAVPHALRPVVQGSTVTLSWAGSAYAESYTIKRASESGGAYTTIGTASPTNLFFVDSDLEAGATVYYVISPNTPDGESADSEEVAVKTSYELTGTVIGTDGSFGNSGAEKTTLFDGWLANWFDGPDSESWAGLDLGKGTAAVIIGVRYCPRNGLSGRMVGGRFQGANAADFSDAVDLCTITEEPPEGELTALRIESSTPFRYVRYISPPGGHGNAAEIQFHGVMQ